MMDIGPWAGGVKHMDNVFEFPSSMYMGKELWEVTAACHGPEDPPAALLRAADVCREPLLVLIASCYEPNAIDVLWPQWILASLPITRAQEFIRSEAAQRTPVEQFQQVAELCLREGYISTLHESMMVFMPESPLSILTSFLYRCIHQCIFDSETGKLLSKFLQHCQRKYSVDTSALPFQLSNEYKYKMNYKKQ